MVALSSCHREHKAPSVMFGQADEDVQPEDYDLTDVQASGELIAVTLSSPDTYYEYRGQGFGLQFAMAQAFANSIGARLRIEMASDTTELLQKLASGEADLVALDFDSLAWQDTLSVKAPTLQRITNGWLVRGGSPQLSTAIARWWRPTLRQEFLAAEQARTAPSNRMHRSMRPPMLSRQKGTISSYDHLFMRAARSIGWDWRLLAAQCYQESGFDPQAISWAGACGLMQLMPATGERLGLSPADLYDPARNIEAASRYIVQLTHTFSDIGNAHERLFFVLAAYNGGAGHIRDAMALAAAEGHSTQRWADVEPYVLALSSPTYYRHPLVKYGYLRGEETVDYVRQIRQRWSTYRSLARHPVQ